MSTLVIVHVALSLIGIVTGFVVIGGFILGRHSNGWTATFLTTTTLTSLTGFLFPIHALTPGIALGILSLLVLIPALLARYRFGLAGTWRTVFVVTSLIAQYFNNVVLVVQSFQKIPVLQVLAPTQSEAPFLGTQMVLLGLFAIAAVLSVRGFRSAVRLPVLTRSIAG